MKPVIHETAFVAGNATVRGNVTIGEGAGIYFGAVLRAETDPITIGPGAFGQIKTGIGFLKPVSLWSCSASSRTRLSFAGRLHRRTCRAKYR